MKIEDFNAGSPYSSWLKEQLIGEVADYQNGFGSSLVKKYKVKVDDKTEDIIMNIEKLDDLPDDLKAMAVEIIQNELDKDFKY
jgi:hypothetical protein